MDFFKKAIWLFFILTSIYGCSKQDKSTNTLFSLLSPDYTGVGFVNEITESDSMNIIDYEYIYNGGGVALADFDNDGFDDIVFSANMTDSKIYHNKQKLQFEDVTQNSGFNTKGFWCTGLNIVDINQDGLKDIYVTTSTYKDASQRRNLLFINRSQGSEIKFEEAAEDYGIADTSFTTNSVFFDYDNDGDLDLLLINNKMDKNDFSRYTKTQNDTSSGKVDKLFANKWDEAKGHSYFTDVSKEAGIVFGAYSLGVNITDINKDGWKDIYITNDFLSNDILYVNNKNGTFSNKIGDYLNHTCFSAMGNDIADINNDGLQDIVAVDMLPETNFRKKTMMGANNYTNYINNNSYKYTFQFVRNVLQLNNGFSKSAANPVFSDIAMLAGIEATDWSWAPLIADFDGDGFRDLIITNGFPKDITDKDFMDYQSENAAYLDKKEILSKIPQVKLKNYAFKNTGNLNFENVTDSWGIEVPSFSNGAAYGDLDNDGDLDYVVNNINDVAHVYQNNTKSNNLSNHLEIQLKGTKPNLDAIGTIVNYKTTHISSFYEHSPSRGYLSVMSSTIFIGMGADSIIDLEVIWPDHRVTKLNGISANQLIKIDQSSESTEKYNFDRVNIDPIFVQNFNVPQDSIKEEDNIDFNSDPLLLKKLSNLGPGIAVADVNNDGNDDYYVAGSKDQKGRLYINTGNGFKLGQEMPIDAGKEELAPLFIDIDGDGDNDLYIGCGSNEFNVNDPKLKDVLLINENGKFIDKSDLLNVPNMQTAVVKACDFDGDGDMDIFIGGKAITSQYPKPEHSFILVNESKPNAIKFSMDNQPFATMDMMVSDALWTDFDGNGTQDLMVIGDFGGINLYKNTNGKLEKFENKELSNKKGWWNSINGADLDNDGDIDYVLGNFGENSFMRASESMPIRVYSKDFDNNSSYDFIPTVFFKTESGKYMETTYHVKGDLTKELNGFKKKFLYYRSLAEAPIDSIITPEFKKDAYIIEANYFKSIVLMNEGNGSFKIKELPVQAQISTVMGTLIDDFNGDGYNDIVLIGNNYGTELTKGRMDASYGLLLEGDGKGQFMPVTMEKSGLELKCEPRSIVSIKTGDKLSYIMTNYDGPIKGLMLNRPSRMLKVNNNDVKVDFLDSSGKLITTKEVYCGNSYLSQSTKNISVPKAATSANIWDAKKEKRSVLIEALKES